MKQTLFIIIIIIITKLNVLSQYDFKTFEKNHYVNSNKYYSGKGSGKTQDEALEAAKINLCGKMKSEISVEVKRKLKESTIGENSKIEENVEIITNSISQCKVEDLKPLFNSERGFVECIVYIDKEQIKKQYEERKQKSIGFVKEAEQAESDLKIDLAIKYYYFAYVLLIGLPSETPTTTKLKDVGEKDLLIYLPEKIREINNAIKYKFIEKLYDSDEKEYLTKILIVYKDQPVNSFVFNYISNANGSQLQANVENGICLVYQSNDLTVIPSVVAEYKFESCWRQAGIKDLMSNLDISFHNIAGINAKNIEIQKLDIKNDYKTQNVNYQVNNTLLNTTKTATTTTNNNTNISSTNNKTTNEPTNISGNYLETLKKVETAIRNKNYENVKDLFTPEGYKIYLDLIKYGNAIVLSNNLNINIIELNGIIKLRSLPMSFSFSQGKRTFTENVVFDIEKKNGLICWLSFALSDFDYKTISNNDYNNKNLILIINFIENYQTSYALKRLDYIEKMFSDSALIIVGYEAQYAPQNKEIKPKDEVYYQRFNKKDFLSYLGKAFKSKEYINIDFSNLKIEPTADGKFYGLTLEQDYYSNNYSDKGYLFLYTNFENMEEPKIHFRSWLPKKDYEKFGQDGLPNNGDMNNPNVGF